MIVFYHNDADGRCAAAIVNKWYHERGSLEGDARGEIIFREMDYKDTPRFNDILDEDVAIVDFSFKPEVMAFLLGTTERVIWCDHHKTAEAYDYGRKLAGIRDFTEKGRSGCECAWEFFFPTASIPEAVSLLGDYDAWRLEHVPTTFEFYEGLKLHDQHPTGRLWQDLLQIDDLAAKTIDTIQQQGQAAIAYRNTYCREIMGSFGYETQIDGIDAYATNFYRFGSQGFADNWKKYPICIAYIHDGQRFTVSLYSETVDVGEIARRHGGGGHKGAAGMVVAELPFKRKV